MIMVREEGDGNAKRLLKVPRRGGVCRHCMHWCCNAAAGGVRMSMSSVSDEWRRVASRGIAWRGYFCGRPSGWEGSAVGFGVACGSGCGSRPFGWCAEVARRRRWSHVDRFIISGFRPPRAVAVPGWWAERARND